MNDRPMTDPKAIDISPEAVEKYVINLRKDDADDWESHAKSADLLSALSAALSEARGKVGELEALREQQAAAFVKFAKDQPVAPHPVDQMENLRRAMTTDIEIEKLEAERESLRSKLAEAERERDEATKYAKTLCESFVHEHCSPVETWKVFPDLIGVLTQIYNATTVVRSIKADRDAAFSELAKLRERTTKLSIDYIVALDEKGKALAELAKLRAEAEWRPIESAPRDGTKVLVALHEFNDPANLYVSCFAAFENGSWIEGGEPIYQPDYFFAIPSPPKDPAHD